MEKEENLQDQSGAEELELEPEVDSESTDEEAQGGDPLDSLVAEPEKLLAEAKKFRAISKRRSKGEKEKQPIQKVSAPPALPDTDPSNFVTKDDLKRIATREAKKLVGAEIAAEWDELAKIPLSGFDPLDPESIAQNLRDRYAILQSKKPKSENKEGVDKLTETVVSQGTGSGPSQAAEKSDVKNPPNFNLPKQPKDWYPTKK